MITSSTLATIVDLPFFFLFMVVTAIIAPPLAWIAPVAALLMILPCVALQKLAVLASGPPTKRRYAMQSWSKAFRAGRY